MAVDVNVSKLPVGTFFGGDAKYSVKCPVCGLPAVRFEGAFAHVIHLELDRKNEAVVTYRQLC